jgi:hypothetical protein
MVDNINYPPDAFCRSGASAHLTPRHRRAGMNHALDDGMRSRIP